MLPSTEPINASARAIDPGVSIGHVNLKVADLDRSIAFYRDVLGFDLMQRYGDEAAFLSAGGYHHHIALNTWESKGGSPPDRMLPASTILQFGIPRGQHWLKHCAGLLMRASPLRAQAITGLARHFTCVILMAMA